MFLPSRHKPARALLAYAPMVMSALLLLGMMVASLLPSRVQAAPKPEKVMVAQVPAPALPPSSGRLNIISAPNSNYSRSGSRRVDTIVMHYISGINVNRSRWDDPALAMKILSQYHVSAHYLVARDGTVYRLVDEKNVAWHAGGSIMPSPDNRKNVNRFSIGIEIIATDKSGFTEAQYASLTKLVGGIKSRYPISHIVGHDEIAGHRATGMGLRKDLKEDPGPLFDWSRFR